MMITLWSSKLCVIQNPNLQEKLGSHVKIIIGNPYDNPSSSIFLKS